MALSFELSGVHPYTVAGIEDAVKRIAPGVFVLDPLDPRGGKTVGYVGRSDTDLSAELQHHVKAGYKRFVFAYTTSPLDGFKKECVMWHEWKPSTNPMHPARPKGTTFPCPVCGK